MTPSRRAFLAVVGSGSALLAGCSQFPGDDSGASLEPSEPPESGVDEAPDPRNDVHGADGSWSSFGCNAANTRAVGDGEAPVDGVSERWRVPVAEVGFTEPIVADERVYFVENRGLRVFDADDGSELWTVEDVEKPPLLLEGTVYVATYEGVSALDIDTGNEIWSRELDAPGSVTAPAAIGTHTVSCGIGERVVALDPEDGTERWHRDAFGQLLDHPAALGVRGVAVATEAGMVDAVGERGVAHDRWELPARPSGPLTADTDTVYVPCDDGETYALAVGDGGDTVSKTAWSAETGHVSTGLAVADDVVLAVAGNTLRAIDADSGQRRWEFGVGDSSRTAPIVSRETVFVGGDRLWALDPAPTGDPSDGPAVRFEREFEGSVGRGPVLDDGVLYVVAEVDDGEAALLALE
ncbi:outer membrane protein assembly factor BamB family protein [Natronococcus occultus]|uniref:WD40-like repeat protein n=1 Tax=Natronococcus occultus SP4 TaxID=694430 RepID=L0JZA9_9EURY|nr:PQQ-binding-like beta-propeller repeat protein [Natronococcus occultus]AGB38362.1 WD40-like repeat protein [Natronococcus occultus SP4]